MSQVAAELFHAGGWTDGRTDMTKSIVAFRDFANAPKSIPLTDEQFVTTHRHIIVQETEQNLIDPQ